jgi:hypothetical protein
LWLLRHCISQWNLPPNSDMKSMSMHVSLIPEMAQTRFRLSATAIPEGVAVAVAAVCTPVVIRHCVSNRLLGARDL